MKIHKEGYPFIVFFLGVSVAFIALHIKLLFGFSMLVTLFMVYFFRDPYRDITKITDDAVLSPADGTIINIRRTKCGDDETQQISIFMSILNVHVNRIPYKGIVDSVKHTRGGFQNARKVGSSEINENLLLKIKGRHNVFVRQVAGLIARRIVCNVCPGHVVEPGQKYGLIKFSSRVDIYVPKNFEILIEKGQRVYSGITIIAKDATLQDATL